MNEAVRPRFAVDLDDIERQLAQAPAAPASSAPVHRNDPLAELARIVGQEDPFQSLLGSDKARSQAKDPAGLDDLFVAPERSRRAQAVAQHNGRGAYEAGPARSASAEPAQAYSAYEPQQAAGHAAYASSPYDQDDFEDNYYQENEADDYPPMDDAAYQPVQRNRSRKGVMALGLLGTVAVVGGGLWLAGSGTGMLSSGEPPLITANNEPVKVQPQTPGGLEIPNQNKQIYERADQDTQTQVVNREEQPVDVREAVRAISGDDPAASQPPTTGGLNLGEPRRVRTVAVRPDGTIIGAEAPTNRPAATVPPPPMSIAPATPAQPASAAPAQERRPAADAPVAAPPRMILPQMAAGGSSPQPSAAPAAEPQRVAAVQPTEVLPAPTGGFAVQLAVSASEAEAQTIFGRLQDKYGDLSGQSPIIRKAEVNGRTLYRVRVGPMSREDASSLCSKLQGQGGECFVAKN